MKYLIANFKANLNHLDIINWLEIFVPETQKNTQIQQKLQSGEIKVVVCPPFSFLLPLKEKISGLTGVVCGAQDISRFDNGRYTGEVTAQSLQGVVEYAIIGHSERRSSFSETESDISQKLHFCRQYQIKPILCIRGKEDKIDPDTPIVCYEPPQSIGTGDNLSLDETLKTKKQLPLTPKQLFFYGGSVNAHDTHQYRANPEIAGFLIGTASVSPTDFLALLNAV